jgi:tetratricopeptide (TPR) repeat protein
MRQVAAANPSNAKIPAMLGQVYFERGLWSQAIPYLEASILNAGNVRGGRNSDTRYYLGIAFRRTDRNVDAATQLREVLRAQPTRYEAICELGEVSLELFRVEEALPLFQRAIPLDPSNERAYAGAARCYRLDKNYDEAMKLYERLVQIRANEPEYLFELGTVYAQLESHEKARRTFLTVIDLIAPGGEPKPESIDRLTECYANLAQTSIAIKNYAEALGHFDSALKLRPNYAPAFDGKGQAYRELENLEQAEVFFKRAIEAAPTKPDYYLNLGVFYHRYKKDTKAALPNYFKYYELGGTDPQVRGWIEEAGGRIPPPIRPDGA